MKEDDTLVLDKVDELAELMLEHSIYPPSIHKLLHIAIWRIGTEKYTKEEFLEKTGLTSRTLNRYKHKYGT